MLFDDLNFVIKIARDTLVLHCPWFCLVMPYHWEAMGLVCLSLYLSLCCMSYLVLKAFLCVVTILVRYCLALLVGCRYVEIRFSCDSGEELLTETAETNFESSRISSIFRIFLFAIGSQIVLWQGMPIICR